MKKRYFWKDRAGNKLTFREFMQRWKKGIDGINPYQQTNSQIWGTIIIVIGILCGLVICIVGIKRLWWLGIILLGALFNTCISYIGLKQKKKALEPYYKKVEIPKESKGGQKNVEEIIEGQKRAV